MSQSGIGRDPKLLENDFRMTLLSMGMFFVFAIITIFSMRFLIWITKSNFWVVISVTSFIFGILTLVLMKYISRRRRMMINGKT